MFVGADSIILPGTKIGNNCIIGAGAVVAHDIPDNSVAVGNPCRIICSFDDFVRREKEIIKNNNVVDRTSAALNSFTKNDKYKHFIVNQEVYENCIG